MIAMHQLQRLLQEIQSDEMDFIIEDESIYSGDTSKLDLGELVAQTFWQDLEPYPKKPGTSPISFPYLGKANKPILSNLIHFISFSFNQTVVATNLTTLGLK
jgi:hypothetical protein